ncbi:MAG: hypothetical protein J7500_06335 [Sphingomonas sp.]|uniref:hypothetical protein n=1 Tax=Sphingomonas sp. TaxID=28214 RepID=UPI001B1F7CF0|nr:hypothetical protein [Sphingomonas sp.]MBO9622314.1 hypothetical protein [Sphingomonas sp.]
MTEQFGDLHEDEVALRVLTQLDRWWPIARDVVPDSLELGGENPNLDLLRAVELLSDRGYLMYEALVISGGVPMFRDALITRSGIVALESLRSGRLL